MGSVVQDKAENAQEGLSRRKRRYKNQERHLEEDLAITVLKLNKAAGEVSQRLRDLEECRKRFSK